MLIVLLSIETLVSSIVEWQVFMNDDECMRQGFFIADYSTSSSNVATNIRQKGNMKLACTDSMVAN